MEKKREYTEQFTVSGDELLARFKELVNEGNVRQVIIRNEQGRDLLSIPLTVGVVGAVLLPVFAAVGAIAALVARCEIVVVRTDGGDEPPDEITA
ncbi:MAG: DUF4342 domain-containing protein [Candidatus Limnocylindria bacterium]